MSPLCPGRVPVLETAAAVALASAAVAAVTLAGETGPWHTVPAAVTVCLTLWTAVAIRHRAVRARLGWLLAAASTLSLTATLAQPRPVGEAAAGWKLAEVGALLALLAATARWAPAREAVLAALPAGAACALWPAVLLDGPVSWLERVGAAATWLLPVCVAVGLGAYPRRLARRTRRVVAAARRRQQLQLARDLHDFVAHDVSAIVAQAQAARFVADTDPGQALPALERIESAGLHALETMDRTVQALREADGARPTTSSPHDLGHLPDLVRRFQLADGTPVRLAADPEASGALGREAQAVGYRVVSEALTNVRRHATAAAAVTVAVRWGARGRVEVEVVDEVTGDHPGRGCIPGTRRHGGHGLVGLRESVTVAGGELTAGPHAGAGRHGWRVVASFPALRDAPGS
ncbi:two-component sensor histidine kinase [Streptomyces sp. 8K308]|uniref:sensor histidine kinase n=1 Tax=Streptomyces sp. 8K308 TaxID=2530388 RepID=UPI00104FD3BA|nr:histidine kinase [Streptomyces sp. 8K308]TDC27300.1 two-component sensor histidine kinase [Streptomyces sp. 8K308]